MSDPAAVEMQVPWLDPEPLLAPVVSPVDAARAEWLEQMAAQQREERGDCCG